MHIGIAFDLKADFGAVSGGPEDLLEEYDSDATVSAIERVLVARGHRVTRLGGGRRFLERLLAASPELVFNIAEGRGSRSREAHVPAACEMLGIPCTHSDPLTMAVTLDKAMAKRVVASCGVPTPEFVVVEHERDLERITLPFPLFAKPLFEGSSMGIRRRSRLADRAQLREWVGQLLGDYREPVLVEEFCGGAEFTVGLLGNGANVRVAGTMEVEPLLVPRDQFVYSLEVKRNPNWAEEISYNVPPKRARAEIDAVEKVALDAWRALGCRDVARIDVRCDASGNPKFIECNPLPGLAPGWSDLAILWDRTGGTYETLVGAILDEATTRLALR
ncbi:MAG: D-alanine--D-alanine ligase [Planctomycetaceae bacterium]|nr:D-alanine--D-alanine ligase [Planctomycetaceae bacterium]